MCGLPNSFSVRLYYFFTLYKIKVIILIYIYSVVFVTGCIEEHLFNNCKFSMNRVKVI